MTIRLHDHDAGAGDADRRDQWPQNVDELLDAIRRGDTLPDDLRAALSRVLAAGAPGKPGRPKDWPDTLTYVDADADAAARHPELLAALRTAIGEDPRVQWAREVEAERARLEQEGVADPLTQAREMVADRHSKTANYLRNLLRGIPATPP